jgi:exopolyphosphatase/guanosine-5'-triphosphate,3'-diphosphate pyrophosphatase
MEAAEAAPGQPTRILASDREVTRLGESVFRTGSVSDEAMRATTAVLARMAALYRKLEVTAVRAVATSAIRDTHNQKEFLERASEAAGTRVEIISGREEARLIHLGVVSVWPQDERRTLILDIGGGSAEIIASEDGHLREAFSKPLGAVRLKEIFLKDDPASTRQLHEMHEYIQEKMASALRRLGNAGWDRAIATSATAAAAAAAVSRTPRVKREDIDRLRVSSTQVKRLYARLSQANLADRRKATGIGPRRAEIIVPGLAVLLDFIRQFHLPAVYYSRAGVRDGIIADLASRNVGEDRARLGRDQRREVENLARRFGVPLERARNVAHIAGLLFTALHTIHGLPPAAGRLLEAAAYLLDTGHYVSSASHHKHSHYLVANSDIAAFNERERVLIAALCRYHRKALPSPLHKEYQPLSAEERRTLTLLIPILRLADNLDRGHKQRIQSVEMRTRDGAVTLIVHSPGDLDLEEWRAERAGEAFRQIYNRAVTVAQAK